MAKKKSSKKKSSPAPDAKGKQLVIVESPSKAKTINRYLGPDYVVLASVGHVRDLLKKAPKGTKAEVPGVALDGNFEPSYEIMPDSKKTVSELKKAAKNAAGIWLATDLDREGEAIAWHLTETLGVPTSEARRVVFNAITKEEIEQAFQTPRPIDMSKVNAQQARRILDRIVGFQVSPLLWKKVVRGLSAGRVQSVAVRLVVEREREIDAFVPDEFWKVAGYFTADLQNASEHSDAWMKWLAEAEKGRTVREKNGWLAEHQGVAGELVEVNGKKFAVDNAEQAIEIAKACGFIVQDTVRKEDPKGKGPAKNRVTLIGSVGEGPAWHIKSIETKRTKSRPSPPFITSTLQQAAASALSFPASMTMRIAQQLYEGMEVKGLGQIGLITYMRTDSTHLSKEAIGSVRGFVESKYGDKYLPGKPNFYASSNKAAQEAHEAIRPTDVTVTPEQVKSSLTDAQFKLYKLIWSRFVACQMVPAEWDATTILIGTNNNGHDLTFKANGRVLIFDGHYRAAGVPSTADDPILPALNEGQELAAIEMNPTQQFTSPPARYSESALIKKLESEGIGRPSTYASIIDVIQKRNYVEQLDRRFYATDLGIVVTDLLIQAFPDLLNVGYTRQMESQLDTIEEEQADWVQMLQEFYGPFKDSLERATVELEHARAKTDPAPYECPKCKSPTVYRFGKNGRFLSCSTYPDCDYSAPVDRDGKPQGKQTTDIACYKCGESMIQRKGRFGLFLGCSAHPDCDGILNLDKKGFVTPLKIPPLTTDLPCPKCEAPLNLRSSKRGPWLSCSKFPKCRGRQGWSKLEEDVQDKWAKALSKHEAANPQPVICNSDGEPIGNEYKPKILSSDEPMEIISSD